jgi:hypothetical protein
LLGKSAADAVPGATNVNPATAIAANANDVKRFMIGTTPDGF